MSDRFYKSAKCALIMLLAAMINIGMPQYASFGLGPVSAYADDDDDDDGGGGGGYSGTRSEGERSESRRSRPGNPRLFRYLQRKLGVNRNQRRAGTRRPAQRAVAPVVFEPRVIIANGLIEPNIEILVAEGFEVVERHALASGEMVKLRTPAGLPMNDARDRVRAIAPAVSADFNHFYRPSDDSKRCGGKPCVAPTLVGWPSPTVGGTCSGRDVSIGMIDTGINHDHPALAGRNIEIIRIADKADVESGKQHGTAVASLLIGGGDLGTPGLLPEARLVAVDAFERQRREDRSEAYQLVRALDQLSTRNVQVVNMSLSGPPNTVFERAIDRMSDANVLLIAAAGNNGPGSDPVYPAAYEKVVAVTAVDRQKKVYRRANRGDHIDIAAPGVGVWAAASIKGTRQKTGTSIATPFVTAAVAVVRSSNPGLEPAQIAQRITSAAQDLGQPGKDDTYGWGLLDVSSLCR